jgi:hypothetical protein
MRKLQKLLILMVMLVLPVQGIAAAFAPLHKAINTQSAGMPCHEQHGTHHAPVASNHHTAAPDVTSDVTADADTTNHLCCHQVFTCAPTRVLNTPAQKFSDVSRFVLPMATLFIPDSPDRPPRG